jgi:hypothetical protein
MRMRLMNLPMLFAGIACSLSLQLAPVAGQGTKLRDSKSVPAKGASATTVWPAHRPDGQPDVQGIWVTKVYGMSCLTDPARGVGCFEAQDGPANPNRPPRKEVSRIIDTPDGEIPYQPWARERQKYLLANYFEPTKPEFLDPQQLCLPLGPVRQFTWHDVQILQYDGYVVFEHEGGHVYQIVPLDGRPHAGANVKLWMGDSRGHWDGNTLVIDGTNNNSKGRLSRAGDFASDKVHITTRIKFIDANNARFEAVYDDPSVYTRTWTFGFDLKRAIFGESNPNQDDAHYEQWEEACYEGLQDIDRSLRTSGPASAEPAQK